MTVCAHSVQLSYLATVRNLPRQVAHYGTMLRTDDVYTASHRNRCLSRLSPIQRGIEDLRPVWKIPGRIERVQNVKMAAVLVPLCFVNQEPSILLTVRSLQLPGYRGEVRYIL